MVEFLFKRVSVSKKFTDEESKLLNFSITLDLWKYFMEDCVS